MSYSIEPFVDPSECEALIETINDFIDLAYTRENAAQRVAYIYEYAVDVEVFAFALHCPGSEVTADLPGFELDAIPSSLAKLTRRVCSHLGIHEGRVLLNVSRYPEHCALLRPHQDGELFDFEVSKEEGARIHSGLRPAEVAVLTLRNETDGVGTTLHPCDSEGEEAGESRVIETRAGAGELLRFDNRAYRHGVPAIGARRGPSVAESGPRWLRYAVGWRALEESCVFWENDGPERLVSVKEAAAAQRAFLSEMWPRQREETLGRGTFPFRSRFV